MKQITSRKNPVAVHMKKLGAYRDYRYEQGEFLCDGAKLLNDAVVSGAIITAVLTSSAEVLSLPADIPAFYVPPEIIASLSPLKNAQDILFSCKMPERQAESVVTGNHLLLDGIQDPGNIGTIIRTANALGINTVMLTGGCADVYNPKAVRASMGAVFRQKVIEISIESAVNLAESGVRIIGASLGDNCVDITETALEDSVIAIGSEGRGLSAEILALCNERVTIPIAPECESLNAAAAAAIIMWEMSRQRVLGKRLFL